MKLIVTVYFLFFVNFLFGQKHDNNWLLGYPYSDTNFINGNTLFNFNNGNVKLDSIRIRYSTEGVVMSDSLNGELQFYCNGCKVLNKLHTVMENGDSLVSNRYWRNWCSKDYLEYPIGSNGYVVIPPFKEKLYRILRLEDDTVKGLPMELYQTTIDMEANNGLGRVIEKRKLIHQDTFTPHISLCKHANGRDWWLTSVKNRWRDSCNVMYSYLITEQGISAPIRQTFPKKWDYWYSADNTVFSPDGSIFVRSQRTGGIFIYDFDRCTGLFSNQRFFKNFKDTLFSISAAISPNSRYLYVSQVVKDQKGSSYIYQFDLRAKDIAASQQLVAEWDGFVDPDCWSCSSRFYHMMLAADNRIYISATNGTKYLSVIEYPDLPGTLCQVSQHSVKLFGYHAFDLPHTPHYRLGALKGSACDTLTATHEIKKEDYHIKVFPNPASTELKIEITLPQFDSEFATEIRIVSSTGAIIKSYTMLELNYLSALDISDVESGFYEVQLRQKNRILVVEKLVVLR